MKNPYWQLNYNKLSNYLIEVNFSTRNEFAEKLGTECFKIWFPLHILWAVGSAGYSVKLYIMN